MRITWKRENELERQLRAQRPEPRHELISEITGAVGRSRARRSGLRARGIAVVLTAAMLVALATTGGLSYAASGVTHAAKAAKHAVAPAKHAKPSTRVGSAQAQYFVAVCFHGGTIRVDSSAEHILAGAGAQPGACKGGSFAPRAKQKWMCIAGQNVRVNRADRAKLAQVKGVTRGFCKPSKG